MIKIIISLAVIVLVWMAVSGDLTLQDMHDLNRKVFKLKESVRAAYDKAARGEHSSTQLIDAKTEGSEKDAAKAEIIEGDYGETAVEDDKDKPAQKESAEAAAEEITGVISPNQKEDKDILTGEELKSVLSILDEAQKYLRKPPSNSGWGPDDDQDEKNSYRTEIIKKKY
ncbi:MAG TPA: hypothetical protein ENG83_05815 [Nitrospirae bacterium]|nr:hypothetical protein BMS3Abin06_01898 [bacterium BMS3Abin06]HDH11699.1 hypothetical protein [Nitrospirota bacterium]HDZ03201.1 hypothetical protein [Nitrospirota bacterium]